MEQLEAARKARNEYMREYRRKNKEKVNAINRKWRKENKEKVAEYNKRYWAKRAKKSQEDKE